MIDNKKSKSPTDKPVAVHSYKRFFDLSVLVLAHLLLLPLWILLWTFIPIAIWLGDRGPVFYKQDRVGKGGRVFTMVKFRTMIVNAENQGPAWTTDNDPRITRVGRTLRRTALDELPEIINIWQGNMSFVGPRALELDEQSIFEELIPGFEKRLQIRPGLTGLAQIFDKTDDPFEKYRYDMEYLQKLNPFLDAQILLRSVLNTLIAGWDRRSGKSKLENLIPGQPRSPSKGGDEPEPTTVDMKYNNL